MPQLSTVLDQDSSETASHDDNDIAEVERFVHDSQKNSPKPISTPGRNDIDCSRTDESFEKVSPHDNT